MERHTHIIRWNDGEADWSMVIQDGRVSITALGEMTEEEAAAELTKQWADLMDVRTNRPTDAK